MEDKKVLALIDTGANISVIDRRLAETIKVEIWRTSGSIGLVGQRNQLLRIGQVKKVRLQMGRHVVHADLELAELGDKLPMIIGMDLFDKLGLKMSNIPITWPLRTNQAKDSNLV